jgi:tryptophanyl-tRNA synthetase
MERKRVLTGYRPTGRLHLGHLHGNIQTMLDLQNEYECFFFVADWHALTTDYENPSRIAEFTREMVLDWLAAGIDSERAAIYRQSDVPEVAELQLYFGMITPLGWLERNPTYKEQLRELSEREIQTYGFLGYPVLQAADILIVQAHIVPVGEDQLPHLELTREIARRFNYLYGDYFVEPQALLSKAPRVPGTDGRKMSKSYGNAIFLTDDPDTIRKKIAGMFTDPERLYRKDPGHPDRCAVFTLHGLYSEQEVETIRFQCEHAEIGCTDCKKKLAEHLVAYLEPFRERRAKLAQDPTVVHNVLERGLARVRPVAREVLAAVHEKMGLKEI